jgi:hypothetical protein
MTREGFLKGSVRLSYQVFHRRKRKTRRIASTTTIRAPGSVFGKKLMTQEGRFGVRRDLSTDPSMQTEKPPKLH